MKDLKRRFWTSLFSIVGIVAVLFFAYHPWLQYVVVLLISALTALAMWEYRQFAKAKGGQIIFPALCTIAVLETAAFYAASWTSLRSLPLLFFFVGFLILFALHFGQKDGAVVDLAVSSFGLLYIAVPIGMLLSILYFPLLSPASDGRWWMAYLLVVTKITDVGAYFGGNLWGRRKLAPSISPGKTVEGAIVGLLCAIGASFGFYWLSSSISALEALVLGLLLGCIGQFGDLSESLLKRDANKKDSNALPGLGGVLDAVDSLLFTAPIIYFYLVYR